MNLPLQAADARGRRAPAAAAARAPWTQLETDALLRAWEAAVPVPRARELSPPELRDVFRRFRAAVGDERCPAAETVQRMVRQVVATFRFITAADARSRRGGGKGWFELPRKEQAAWLDGMPADSLVIKGVSADFFREISRLCREDAAGEQYTVQRAAVDSGSGGGAGQEGGTTGNEPTSDAGGVPKERQASGPSKPQGLVQPEEQQSGAASTGAVARREPDEPSAAKVIVAPQSWSTPEVHRFLRSWGEAVDEFLAYGNAPHESVKLPSWLVRQRWLSHGGSHELTVERVTDSKRWIIMAFQAICDCLAELLDDTEDPEASPNWFALPFNERFKGLCNRDVPAEAMSIAYRLTEDTFDQIAAILKKEAVLSTVVPLKADDGQGDEDDAYLSPSIEAELSMRRQQIVVVSRRSAHPELSKPDSSAAVSDTTIHAEEQPPMQNPEPNTEIEHTQASRKRPLPQSTESEHSNVRPQDPSRHGDVSEIQEAARPQQRLRVEPGTDCEDRPDAGTKLLALLDRTQRDYYCLVDRARMERVHERQRYHSLLLDLVRRRCNPSVEDTRAFFLRELALQQSQQLVVDFLALHREREHQRGQQQRRLVSALRSRLAGTSTFPPPAR